MRAPLTAKPVSSKACTLIIATGLFALILSAVDASETTTFNLQLVLMQSAVTPPARVDFHEERHNALLQAPLVLTGYLEYLGAGVLRKVVETPFEEAFLVDAEKILIERDGETRTLSLGKSRSLRTILDVIKAILGGDAHTIESIFDYELAGTAESWSVRLTPRSKRISRQLTRVLVSGDLESVKGMRIDLQDGEWHQMDILQGDSGQ